jgi:hypothetical protein
MKPQSKHAHECAAVWSIPSGIRGGADVESLDPAVDVAPFATCAGNDKPLRHKMRPLTLSLLGLALAVVFWGLEYKVSLYHPHTNHTARVGVAKLWVGPRKAVFAKSNCIKSSASGALELHLLAGRCVTISDSDDRARGWQAEPLFGDGRLSYQTTPRSPPAL